MNARVDPATGAAATNGKARASVSPSQQKEDLANEVGRVRAMLQLMCDLAIAGKRDTVEIEAEAFGEVADDLQRRLAAVSERILQL